MLAVVWACAEIPVTPETPAVAAPAPAAPAGGATCSSDADCKGGRVCAGSCMSKAEAATRPGACHSDQDCKGDRVCEGGRCTSPGGSSAGRAAGNAAPAATPPPPRYTQPTNVPTLSDDN